MPVNRSVNSEPGFTTIDADWSRHATAIRAIRHAVFVSEQGIPASLEWDRTDGDCVHVLALTDSGQPVATGRLQADGKLGRMAVLSDWRGRGIGRAILAHLLAQAHGRQLGRVYLHAQLEAVKFYRKAGFRVQGTAFEEAGITHIEMVRQLT